MAYTTLDLREVLRDTIGTACYIEEKDLDTYCIQVTDDMNDTINIPLLLPGEVRGGDLPEMPFIEMNLVSSPEATHNIGGNIKRQDVYINFNLYYTNTDNISATTFGKDVTNEILDKVTSNRNSITGTYFCEVINAGIEYLEPAASGHSVVFHRVVEIKMMNYENGA